MSGLILYMNILALKRSGRPVDTDKDVRLVKKAVDMLGTLCMEYVSL